MDPIWKETPIDCEEWAYYSWICFVSLVSGHWVAVKIMESIADNIEEVEEEFQILRDLCLHPNIPSFHGLYLKKNPAGKREEDQLWFVMELCSGGSVTDLVHNLKQQNRSLSEEQIAYILRETLEVFSLFFN